ncbi:MAG: hypothetical protein ACTSWY_04655 [Promethearchaeota archaeon]
MVEKNHLICYNKLTEFFIEELGFKPFRSIPENVRLLSKRSVELQDHSAIWKKNNESGKLELDIRKGKATLIKGFLARECLSSFFTDEIRGHPLIQCFIYNRLILGKFPLNIYSKNALNEFFIQKKDSLQKELAKDSVFVDWLEYFKTHIFSLLSIDLAFKQFVHGFANFREFLTKNGTELIDAILVDYQINSDFSDFSLKRPNKFRFFIEAVKLFHEKKGPYSMEFLKNNLKKKYNNNNNNNLVEIIGTFNNKPVAFTYQLNYMSLNLDLFFYFIRFSPRAKKETLDYCFENLLCKLTFSRENISQDMGIKAGTLRCPSQDFKKVNNFFRSLKNYRIIDEFILFKYDKYKHIKNFVGKKSDLSANCYLDYDKIHKHFNHPDIIDFLLFRLLKNSGKFGFKLTIGNERIEIFRRKIKNEIRILTLKLNELISLKRIISEKKVKISNLKYLIPLEMKSDQDEIENITIKQIINTLIKRQGFIQSKYLFEHLLSVYSLFSEINTCNSKLFEKNDDITEFIDQNLLKTQNTKEYLSLKSSLKSLDSYIKNLIKYTNFNDWILNPLKLVKIDPQKFSKILKILQIIRDFFNICAEHNTEEIHESLIDDIKENTENLKVYLNNTIDELRNNFDERIRRMEEADLIIPNMVNSISLHNLYTIKTLLLRNIDINHEKILTFAKLFPDMYMFSGKTEDNGNQYLVIEIYFHPSFNKSIKKIIKSLFTNEIVFFGQFFGETYITILRMENLFDFTEGEFTSLEKHFNDIIQFLKNFSKSEPIEDYRDKEIQMNQKASENSEEKGIEDILESIPSVLEKSGYDSEKISENVFGEKEDITDRTIEYGKYQPFLGVNTNKSELEHEFLKKVIPLSNYGMFGLSKYIVQFKFSERKFDTHGIDEISTSELLLCPGFSKIESSTDLGYLQNHFIHYITPKDDPPSNILNYAAARGLISPYRLMKVKKIYIGHSADYLFGLITWKSSYMAWDIVVKKILYNPSFRFKPKYIEYDLTSDKEMIYYGNSLEFQTLVKYRGKNLKKLYHLTSSKKLRDLTDEGVIKPYPVFNFDNLKLYERIILFFGPINSNEQTESLLMIFSTLPFAKIYDVEYTDYIRHEPESMTDNDGLLVELRLPNSRLEGLFDSIKKIADYLKIDLYRFISNVVEISPSEFTDNNIRKTISPLQSHIWSKRTKKWRRIHYFDKKGRPLNYKDRKSLLQ